MIEWLAAPRGRARSCSPAASCPTCCARRSARASTPGPGSATWSSPSRCGTAGAIRFAADALGDELDERFLALNGDVLTDLDLTALLAAHEERGGAGDDRPLPGRGLRRLRPRQRDGERRRARVPREDRRAGAGRDQRRRLRARALGARPDPAGRARSRSSARSSRGWSATGLYGLRARGLLDGHRHPRALPAGELGHPRGPGRDAGRADRRPACWSAPGPRSPPAPRSARAPSSRAGLPRRRRRRGARIGPARRLRGRRRAPGSAARSSPPGATVEAGATVEDDDRRPR